MSNKTIARALIAVVAMAKANIELKEVVSIVGRMEDDGATGDEVANFLEEYANVAINELWGALGVTGPKPPLKEG